MTPLLAAHLTKRFQKIGLRRSVSVSQWEQVLLGFLLAVATTLFVMQGFCVAGDCMQPHLYTGERVLANKLAYHLASPKRHALPEIVRALKSFSARRINNIRHSPGALVWQRNYSEHVIRSESELSRVRAYIQNNPARWTADAYFTLDGSRP